MSCALLSHRFIASTSSCPRLGEITVNVGEMEGRSMRREGEGEEGSYCSANTNRETVDKDEQGIEMNRGEAENQGKLGEKLEIPQA